MYETLEILRDGPVATVWMNRPEVHNAFNAQLIADLTNACRALDEDRSVRVVVLAGRGRSFSAGADLNWMRAAGEASVEANIADARHLADMLRSLAELSKPTIARVHGAALGGGMGLACACDICIAGEGALFATSEVRLGLIPSAIGPYVLRAIGARQAGRYFLSAERIPAERAAQLGLAHEVVADAALDERIAILAAFLLQGGPAAQAAAKELIRAIDNRPVCAALVADTAVRIARLRATPEAREGLDAFLSRRPAAWTAQDRAE